MPKTKLGKWSIVLIIAMPLLFVLARQFMNMFYESVSAGDTILQDIAKRPALALTMLTGMACGVSSFITGLIAIIRKKERSVLVYISTFIGFLFTLFLIAEVAFPH